MRWELAKRRPVREPKEAKTETPNSEQHAILSGSSFTGLRLGTWCCTEAENMGWHQTHTHTHTQIGVPGPIRAGTERARGRGARGSHPGGSVQRMVPGEGAEAAKAVCSQLRWAGL